MSVNARRFGIRYKHVNHVTAGGWKRGVQYKRDPKTGRWSFWRDTWPNEMAAELRLEQILAIRDAHGRQLYVGHVFEIVEYPNATHYSPNFRRSELECKGVECRGKRPEPWVEKNLRLLAVELEKLRDELGPISIVSGYRCLVHNRAVNGAVDSQHMHATAADLVVPHGQQDRYVAGAKKVPAFNHGGIGVYPNGGVHVDRRGYVARWNSWVGSR
jgi:hypothetical protein